MSPRRARAWAQVLVVACAACLAACTAAPAAGRHVTIGVAPAESQADQPVGIKVSGLPPRDVVSLRLRTTDAEGVTWSSSATFRASQAGVVDPAASAAVAGTYTGVSAMGLFWSMQPQGRPPGGAYLWPGTSSVPFQLSVTVNGAEKASARLSRRLSERPISVTPERVGTSGFYGEFVSPAAAARRPAVLIIGGSQGGLASTLLAALLAAHGYPALAIAYFKEPGLPSSPSGIPLEYLARALRWLRGRPQVDPGHVFTLGISFGSEAALLLGAHYPGLVNGVIASDPSGVVTSPCTGCSFAAWTLHGRPLPYTTQLDNPDPAGDPAAVIPVQRIRGPVFLDCGGADRVWASCGYARAIMARLAAHRDAYRHILASYPAAGHGVGYLVPYQPVWAERTSPQDAGAATGANPDATAQLWPRLLQFLAGSAPTR
jgi:dienelactone hydrolase